MNSLSPERARMTTASMAPLIVHGSAAEQFQHWMERTAQVPPPDLTNNFPVQWGKHGEPFVLDWIERSSGIEITERQRFVKHPSLSWLGCTLDGYRPFDDAVVECKILNPFTSAKTIGNDKGFLEYYMPQLIVQMVCRCARIGLLAVQQGNSPPQLFNVPIDPTYETFVLERLAAFQQCVDTRTPPGPAPDAPVPPERWRSIDLDAQQLTNAEHALKPLLERWRDTKAVHAEHEQAKKDIKTLLPDDVGRVSYGTMEIKRSRNGAVTIVANV